MKKVFFLIAFFVTCAFTTVIAQGGGQMDPAARLERMKQMYKPQLIEKAKITDAEADKVVAIVAEMQPKMRPIMQDQSLSDDDKKKKMDELNAERTKKFKDIPLTDDQVKAVDATLIEIRKNMMQGGGPRPGGGK